MTGAHGVRLHCSRESAGWDSHAALFEVHHGRIHVGHALIFIYLEDIDPGEGGLIVVCDIEQSCVPTNDLHLILTTLCAFCVLVCHIAQPWEPQELF